MRGEYFTNRHVEIARIRTAMLTPSSLLVYGLRRMGKSSAIVIAGERARAARPKPIVVSADVSTATSLFDVATRLLRSLYQETRFLRLRFEDVLGGLAPRVTLKFDTQGNPPAITFGIDRRTATDEERRRAFEDVIERLVHLRSRTKRPVAVVLDEFQAINAIGGEGAEWHLRDAMQRHGDLSFICAGSQQSLIEEMIGPTRAFYKAFDMLHMGPLEDAHFASWIDERLRLALRVEGDVGGEIVRVAGPRTQDVVQVARQLFFRGLALDRPVEPADVADALDDVVRNEEPLIRSIWNRLAANQQDVLRVVALGATQLFSAEVRDRYGLPAASSVHKAVEALVAHGLLLRDERGIAFDSPFVERWARREVAPDVG